MESAREFAIFESETQKQIAYPARVCSSISAETSKPMIRPALEILRPRSIADT